ncbi:MAG: hypothetical protein ACRDLB_03640 [Actinomycetota bacterium]
MPLRSIAVALVALLSAACGGDGDESGGSGEPSEVTGVVVDIEAEQLGDVTSFDVKDGDTIYQLFIDPEAEYSFPLGHLHEHLQTAQPVRCEVEERDGRLYAQTIEDA